MTDISMDYKGPKMDPVWKTWWLRALRGRGFKQGRGRLRTLKDRACCLGVLADGLTVAHPTLGKWELTAGEWWIGQMAWTLSPRMLERAKITTAAQECLTNANDNLKWTFAQIADWIERHL